MMNSAKSILVVDDDVLILRLVREALTSLACCEVDTTPNPQYAFELILKKPYDLLIFDYTMSPCDGATLYGFVQILFRVALPDDRNLPPLLLMTGNAGDPGVQKLLKEPGVRGLLSKPFTIDRLVERVGEILAVAH